jgi:hypothetical protein
MPWTPYRLEVACESGHDVEWVRETAKGIPDETVLARSVRDSRILLTEDFDYGDLIFARGHASIGVVIIQLSGFPGTWSEVASEVAMRLDEMHSGFPGMLTVLGRMRIKPRALPAR